MTTQRSGSGSEGSLTSVSELQASPSSDTPTACELLASWQFPARERGEREERRQGGREGGEERKEGGQECVSEVERKDTVTTARIINAQTWCVMCSAAHHVEVHPHSPEEGETRGKSINVNTSSHSCSADTNVYMYMHTCIYSDQ